MNETVLQQHLQNKTVPLSVIRDTLRLEKSTVHKWAVGRLYPQRSNAIRLIEVFGEHGIEMDFNDIYKIRSSS